MLLFPNVTEDYPEFTEYVYYRFPSVLDSTTIVHNMAVFGSLDRSSFAAALSPGTPPYIDVEHTQIGGWGRLNSHDLGAMQCSTRLIVLEALLVERFDWDPTSMENMFTTASGRKAPMVGAVLLHWLCDWGSKCKGGIDWPEIGPAIGGYYDPGYEFEKAVYGTRVAISILPH